MLFYLLHTISTFVIQMNDQCLFWEIRHFYGETMQLWSVVFNNQSWCFLWYEHVALEFMKVEDLCCHELYDKSLWWCKHCVLDFAKNNQVLMQKNNPNSSKMFNKIWHQRIDPNSPSRGVAFLIPSIERLKESTD